MPSGIIFGGIMRNATLPDWEQVLSAAARLQSILPEAILVGGTAAAIYVDHRFSRDADHVLSNLKERFDEVLGNLEAIAGWKTARIQRPVQILGSLDGIETGIRQLIRSEPLETKVVECQGNKITLPTLHEILRIKGVLVLKRNATRDYLDFVALAEHIGHQQVALALSRFDLLYPQPNGESPLQQLQTQLANPMPFDLDEIKPELSEYKNLAPHWHNWETVKTSCINISLSLFDKIS
jgi:hypothetical protein